MSISYWQRNNRLSRRRLLKSGSAGAAATAFLIACGGGDDSPQEADQRVPHQRAQSARLEGPDHRTYRFWQFGFQWTGSDPNGTAHRHRRRNGISGSRWNATKVPVTGSGQHWTRMSAVHTRSLRECSTAPSLASSQACFSRPPVKSSATSSRHGNSPRTDRP